MVDEQGHPGGFGSGAEVGPELAALRGELGHGLGIDPVEDGAADLGDVHDLRARAVLGDEPGQAGRVLADVEHALADEGIVLGIGLVEPVDILAAEPAVPVSYTHLTLPTN